MTNIEIKDMIVKFVSEGKGDAKDIIEELKKALLDSDNNLDIDKVCKFREDTGLSFVYKESQDITGRFKSIGVKYHESAFEFTQVK